MSTDTNATPIAIYARTNTSNTEGSFNGSIAEQLHAIRIFAKYNYCRIVKEYKDECLSGISKGPSNLKNMMYDVNKQNIHIKYLVVCDWARVSRNEGVLALFRRELRHSKIEIICINNSLTALIENLKRPPSSEDKMICDLFNQIMIKNFRR